VARRQDEPRVPGHGWRVVSHWCALIVALFGGGEATGAFAVRGLRIVSAGFFFYAYGMVLTNAFNGAGDTRTPTLLNLFCFWLIEIPLAFVLSRVLGFGPTGVFAAIMIAFSTLAAAAAVVFSAGTGNGSLSNSSSKRLCRRSGERCLRYFQPLAQRE
jgi:Na+-driven multidrug efflux pump